MSLNDAVTEYLAVLDTDTGYSSKRLATALDGVRVALVAKSARKPAAKKPAVKKSAKPVAKKRTAKKPAPAKPVVKKAAKPAAKKAEGDDRS